MGLFSREFTAQSVATATGIDARKISDWATRGLIIRQKDGGGVQGSIRKYSFFNVMEVAIAATAMEQFNSMPGAAFELSRWFAHVGSRHSGIVGEPINNDQPIRYRGAADMVMAVRKKIGAESYDLHALRHTAAAELAALGLSDEMIQAITGHSSAAMIAHYSGPAREGSRESSSGNPRTNRG